MILTAPFRLPPDFLPRFGYSGGRRFVAIYWEPAGDEACYDDGVSYACGCCDNHFFLNFIRNPQVRCWLDGCEIDLGSSDAPAQHWLVVDTTTGGLYAIPCHDAKAVLRSQQLPGDDYFRNEPCKCIRKLAQLDSRVFEEET